MSAAKHDRLENFPVTFFAVMMGLLGLVLSLTAAERAAGLAHSASQFVLGAAIAVFAVLIFFYGLKLARHPRAVLAEWNHPVRIAFFPTVSISLLLLGTALAPVVPGAAFAVWSLGVTAQAILALSVVGNWIGHRPFQPLHLSPAWFIPAVGNVVVPLAGVQFGAVELSWLFFSAGLLFWIVLLTLVMNRLIFHEPLPSRLMPTLVILIAPPAVAFIAWVRLTGEVDAFARILLNSGYVFALIVLTQAPRFFRLPFALSWWALTFPLAALSVASYLFASETGSDAHKVVGFGLTGALVIAVATLVWRTARAIRAREICRPE
ncbi:C4-dicarboxylate ABC transporter [Hoeflea olei]|uniref:C4-dicarboxylate ABC transporter n=2 Tax=Hoeflea olei TaxID=1480615 RepID=A0A1C1YX78_9HYPH|nr:C4-dicarboxylate ABC transporter [Hoeflea olei]